MADIALQRTPREMAYDPSPTPPHMTKIWNSGWALKELGWSQRSCVAAGSPDGEVRGAVEALALWGVVWRRSAQFGVLKKRTI
jgi:hypothetical protein